MQPRGALTGAAHETMSPLASTPLATATTLSSRAVYTLRVPTAALYLLTVLQKRHVILPQQLLTRPDGAHGKKGGVVEQPTPRAAANDGLQVDVNLLFLAGGVEHARNVAL